MVSQQELAAALREVKDPHFGVSLEDMGMVKAIHVDGDRVAVSIVYPCLGCPAWSMIQQDIKDCLIRFDGVADIEVKIDFQSDWQRSDISFSVREGLREVGIAV